MPRAMIGALLPGLWLTLALLAGPAPARVIDGVPYIEQSRAPWCAAAAAVMIGRFHGRDLALKPLVRSLPVHADGIAWLDLIEALPAHGLSGWVVQADVSTLRAVIDAGQPAIVITDDGGRNHALVVRGYDGEGWHVLDPANPGLRRLTVAALAARWTGGLVLVQPIATDRRLPSLPLARWATETARFQAEGWLRRARTRPSLDALALLDRAEQADPSHPAVALQQAAVFGELKRGPEACAAVQRARSLTTAPTEIAVITQVAGSLGCLPLSPR